MIWCSGPNRAQSPVEWEDFLSIGQFVHPSICPTICLYHCLSFGARASQARFPAILLAKPASQTDGCMDGQMDGRTENLPILQDLVPYRGRCPATAKLQPKNCIKRGKGTADHMMALGDWLIFALAVVDVDAY